MAAEAPPEQVKNAMSFLSGDVFCFGAGLGEGAEDVAAAAGVAGLLCGLDEVVAAAVDGFLSLASACAAPVMSCSFVCGA